MNVTTVRFDPDAWAKLSIHSERLRIAKAAFLPPARSIGAAVISAFAATRSRATG
jgi:hypothetical protein